MAVAVVSGATGCVGRAITGEFARAGHGVVALGRDRERLTRLTKDLGSVAGPRFETRECDLTDIRAVDALGHDLALDLRAERVVLVNCAGQHGPLGAFSANPAAWCSVLTVNLTSAAILTAALLPGMIERRWGRIINVSSEAALSTPSGLNSPYAVSKAALNRLTAELAAASTGTGITAHAMHPGDVVSGMHSYIARAAEHDDRLSDFASWARRTSDVPDDPRSAARCAVDLVDDGLAADLNGMFLWPAQSTRAPRDLRVPHE